VRAGRAAARWVESKLVISKEAIMAGKLQFAAKILLGTGLLASGVGGVYYAATHGISRSAPACDDKHPSANLDAVGDAWNGLHSADSKIANATKESKPIVSKNDTHKTGDALAKLATDDRYAMPLEKPHADDHAKPRVANGDKDKTDAKKSAEPVAKKAADTKTRAALANADVKREVAASSAAPREPTIARGQEPRDDMPVAVPVQSGTADIGSSLDHTSNDGTRPPTPTGHAKEPKTLTPIDPPTNTGDASPAAKQAFGNSLPAPPTDRYAGANLVAAGAAGQSKDASVNPFGPAPISAQSNPATNAKNDRIQPLPTSGDTGSTTGRDFLSSNSQSGNELRSFDSNRTARTGANGFGSKDRAVSASPYDTGPRGTTGRPASLPTSASPTGNEPFGQTLGSDGAGKPGEKALEGVQQPTLVLQKFAPGEIQVGKPAKFVMQIRNAGAQAADNVVVQDEIPAGTQLISTSPSATNEGGRIVWQLGKLSPGEDRTVEMQLMPKAEGDIGSVATVTYSAQASVKTHCTMPQLAIRMTAPSEVMIGNQQHVKIEIRNPGSGDATGVMIFENVPANMKHVAGPALEFEIGTLRAGETRDLDLVLTAEKAGKVTNVLTARAQGNLQVQQQVEFEVIAPALAVAVQGPERRYLERPATYEVSVQNPGTAPAHDVQIVTKLPKGMKFVKANNMGEYDATTHAVYWSLAELPKGEKGTVELTAMPIETGQQTLQVESHAQQGLADKTQRDVLIEGLAAIKFDVHSLQDPVEVNGDTGYEIRVSNQGTKAATNLQIAVELPAGLKLTSAEGETQHRMDQNRIVFEPLQQLAPKADTVYKIHAQATQAGDQRIVVEVKSDDLAQPLRSEQSTRVFGDQ
jgi:uncharacterized repeat protein (TIGR01451 family)